MKIYRLTLFVLLSLVAIQAARSQNKKFDKALRKVDSYFAEGSFLKAKSSLLAVRKSIASKMGQKNSYVPGLYLREARIDLASGILDGFDKTLSSALTSSMETFGENSASYAGTMIEIADIYNTYGNFRLSRKYLADAKELLNRTNQLTDYTNGQIILVEAEAMTGQGFCNEAISLLKSSDSYFVGRAKEKESIVDGDNIKTLRVPERRTPGTIQRLCSGTNTHRKCVQYEGQLAVCRLRF